MILGDLSPVDWMRLLQHALDRRLFTPWQTMEPPVRIESPAARFREAAERRLTV